MEITLGLLIISIHTGFTTWISAFLQNRLHEMQLENAINIDVKKVKSSPVGVPAENI
jgi:hypothetical protein